ncbi:unnamed protein product [Peronospora destructor]|uniref:Uncharacterized protein n=1 Tax=Peronospora destructor TaxID=86335 RepID=A0AAV0UMI1_9STRA|nr:unnamed protein product [Peronospora destructor]
MVTPVTMEYDIERMSRHRLHKCIDSFVKKLDSRPPLDQLARIEAKPGLMLPAMASKERLDLLAHYRSVCRLLASTRPDPISTQAKNALFVLSTWDLVLHIMAPTVYHDPLKLYVLTDALFRERSIAVRIGSDFLKTLCLAVQALTPEEDGTLTPRLHF